MVEVFNEIFKIGQVGVKNVLAARRAFGSGEKLLRSQRWGYA
jgi:hypothetical protein